MTQITRRPMRRAPQAKPTPQLGRKPTNSQKLLYIAQSLGLDLSGMQGSTMNIFDTVPLSYSAQRQTLEFFVNTQGKARTFSNFQSGQLNAGEALVMEEVKFFLMVNNSSNLTDPANTILTMQPLGSFNPTTVAQPDSFKAGMINVTIANSQVIKDYQINDIDVANNKKTTGISPVVGLTDAGVVTFLTRMAGQNAIELEAPPVLPPNQKFKITLEIPPINAGASNAAIMCVVGRFGCIFSAKTPL